MNSGEKKGGHWLGAGDRPTPTFGGPDWRLADDLLRNVVGGLDAKNVSALTAKGDNVSPMGRKSGGIVIFSPPDNTSDPMKVFIGSLASANARP